ncbi:hypothetical protein SGQ44_15925 [Flavobacterium sp. Fl-77]|uniref:Uncharacterized protein n=1 Tax=Flavobacterium flavipigmentatum TaxID=2893884 RepID=A0AAJ2SJR0_9FLAO|nr:MULTISPECIES: hypothetical protein [unclassified Flavobacterium]MDX6183786.1 hypothetical protein [Flavobacterium sp. Fl-33]MDX6187253.1 hypothetical protein [Flavobacterium sp. Fl-77]UFH38068.1 hypothetical protein LNP22_15170 [Flavobacterium sp. F-70]
MVGIFTLIFGLSIIFFDIKSGYRLSVLYLIPSIFVAVGLFAIFNESILRWLNKIMTKEIFEKNTKFIFFILPLSIFSIIGFLMMFFAFKLNWDVDLLGWSTISIFAFFPLIMIYGLVFGFSIPEKRQRLIEESQEKRREKLFSNDKGITIEMPLFDKNCFISWPSIEAIIYYNYVVRSDFTEYYEGYKLYLNSIPVYTKYEKQWWLNKLFPKDAQHKIIDINNETEHFSEIPKIVEKYLKSKVTIDFTDPMKGTLTSSKIYKNKNSTTTIEKWKPSKKESEQIVFDKFNRSLEEIKKNYR